jgi:hypothetical protein
LFLFRLAIFAMSENDHLEKPGTPMGSRSPLFDRHNSPCPGTIVSDTSEIKGKLRDSRDSAYHSTHYQDPHCSCIALYKSSRGFSMWNPQSPQIFITCFGGFTRLAADPGPGRKLRRRDTKPSEPYPGVPFQMSNTRTQQEQSQNQTQNHSNTRDRHSEI